MEGEESLYFNDFLMDPEKTLSQRSAMHEDNMKVLLNGKNDLLSTLKKQVADSLSEFHTYTELKGQHFANHKRNVCQKSQLDSILAKTKRKGKEVANLEHALKQLTTEYEKVAAEKEREARENQETLDIYEKALKYYTSIYQYSISKIQRQGEDKERYSMIITFFLNGLELGHPMEFHFDRKNDNLFDLEAKSLMTDEQKECLMARFRETNNILALICTLRNLVLAKQ